MALSLYKESSFDVLSIPLVGGSDKKWEDNTWLIEHLRQIADKIEDYNFQAYSFHIEVDGQYRVPRLVIKGFQRDKVIGYTGIGIVLTLEEFQGMPDRRKWIMSEMLFNVQWRCNDCGNLINKGATPQMPKEGEIRICPHCDAILTRHLKHSPANPPFNYYFSINEIFEGMTYDEAVKKLSELLDNREI